MRIIERTVDSRIFALKDPFLVPPSMNLVFWKILSAKQMLFWGYYMELTFLLHIHQMCLLYCTLTKDRACWPHHWMPKANHSATHQAGGQEIFVQGLNLTACHSLCPAFDVCREDTKLINAIQRQRFDILVSLRGFVSGQGSVIMKILKTDWTECVKPPSYPYPIPALLVASERCWGAF